MPHSLSTFSFTPIDVPGSAYTDASGINDRGQIVGWFEDSMGNGHGFLDTAGSFTPIDVPGSTITEPLGINDRGQIVGDFFDSTGHEHGFLDIGGSFTPIDVPGSAFTVPLGINDRGQIMGSSHAGLLVPGQGFLATPAHGFPAS